MESTGAPHHANPDLDAEEEGGARSLAYEVKGVDLATALQQDAADESLNRYKQQLLGAASSAAALSADTESRRVVIRRIVLQVDGRPDIIMPLESPEAVAAASSVRLVVKEGASYTLRIHFTVHRDVVLGLKWTNKVYRLGVCVDTDSVVLGAYGPRSEPHYEFSLPPAEWPSGMLARGSYTAVTSFVDAEKGTHLSFKWGFDIKKDWAD